MAHRHRMLGIAKLAGLSDRSCVRLEVKELMSGVVLGLHMRTCQGWR
jgi:hypothetical protein